MSERPTVILALTPLAERELEPLLFDVTDAPLTLLSSAVEGDELQRAVEQEKPDAVLVSPELSGLTTRQCTQIRAVGTRLIGVALDERERRGLDAMSIEQLIDPAISRDELLLAVRGTTEQIQHAPVTPAPAIPERRNDAGTILAFVGTKGAPGASECAASLATLAASQWPTVLVELDALGGSLDVRLGANPSDGSLLGLVRAADSNGVQRELLERWLTQNDGWPPVLLSPPDPDAFVELAQPGAISCALNALATLYPVTVCDVGALLADPGGSSATTRLHREALIAADAVLLVLGSHEAQLRHGLHQLDLVLDTLSIPTERLRVIVNGIGAPGGTNRAAITETITAPLAERGLTVDAWLPSDTRALTRAQRRGTALAAAGKRSRYTRSLSDLMNELFLPTARPAAKRRKRRLPAPGKQADEEQIVWQR